MSLRNSYFNFLFRICGKKLSGNPILFYTLNSLMLFILGMSKLEKLCLHMSIWNLQKQCGIPVSAWNWKLLVFCQVDFRLTCVFWRFFWISELFEITHIKCAFSIELIKVFFNAKTCALHKRNQRTLLNRKWKN